MSTDQPPLETPGDLRDYLRPLRQHKVLIIAVGVLGLVGAWFLYPLPAASFASQAQVLVGPGVEESQGSGQSQAAISLETEQNVVRSTAVATPAKERLQTSDTPSELVAKVAVTVPRNSQVLVISFTDDDPERAQAGAQAFADAYLEFRAETLSHNLEARRQQLTQQLRDLQGRLDQANVLVAQTEPNSSAQNSAEAAREVLANEVKTVTEALFALDSLTVNPGTVIAPATLPAEPITDPQATRRLAAAAAFLIGLGAGIILAYVREALDDRLRDPEDLEHSLGAPVLAFLPGVSRRRRKRSPVPVMVAEPYSAAAEDYRRLRAAFLTVAAKRQVKTVLVTSVSAGEGKTTVAANLSVALARADRSVILVSADVWAPRVHELFSLPDGRGLADVVAGDADLGEVLRTSGVDNLRVLTSRRLPDRVDLLGSRAAAAFLADLRQRADFVLLDSAPLVVADPLTLASQVDGVLLVAEGRTRRRAVVHAAEQLADAGATIVGAVLTKFKPRKARHNTALYVREHRRRRRYAARPPQPPRPADEPVTVERQPGTAGAAAELGSKPG